MAAKILSTSGAFAASGQPARVLSLVVSASGGVGTAVIKAGGSSGSAATITFSVLQNDTVQINLRGYGVIGDYLTLANATAMVEFQKGY